MRAANSHCSYCHNRRRFPDRVRPAYAGNDLGVSERMERIGPQVRVRIAGFSGEGEVVHVFVRAECSFAQEHDLGPIFQVGPGQFQAWQLQIEAVHENEVRLGQLDCIRWGRFKSV